MSVSKEPKRGTWTVFVRYKDWKGNTKEKRKRGFATKREALDWERDFVLRKSKDVTMGFVQFVEIYFEDMTPRLKPSTLRNKRYIVEDKILPYFKNKSLSEITVTDIIQWQNELLMFRDEEGKPYSETYLRTVNNQLSAIFNYAYKYYDLPKNPCKQIDKMGKAKAKEMLFWTKKEYLEFSEQIKDKPITFYAFEILYWCGIRMGELLALTRKDVDLENRKLHVNKNRQVVDGKTLIMTPKTDKSNRVLDLPQFLCDELEDYFEMIYKCDDDTTLFEISKSYLHHEMDRGTKASSVKRIRIHDLRHSHVAYLIELGFSTVEIAERLGHENISVTSTYSHLYPSKQRTMADRMDRDRNNDI